MLNEIAADFQLELAAMEAESMGWILLEQGVYQQVPNA